MSQLLLEKDNGDGVVTLTLNQPELRNPITDLPMVNALIEALERADSNTAIRCLVLTGAGSAFSAGGNLKRMGDGMGLVSAEPMKTRSNYRYGIQRIPLVLDRLEVPVVAAVNGPAIGAGCDLACMCDIRLAGESACFAESFVKLGLVPGDGGAWLLPRVVGFSKASEMALTGDTLDAEQALSCGLVSAVVPDSNLLHSAVKMARRIAANPSGAVRMTKRLLREGRMISLPAMLELSAALQAIAHVSKDHKEALAAFLAKGSRK